MTDNLIANGLIYREDAIEIHTVLSTTRWTDQHTEWLLMKVLPKTDNLGYMKFCCLLRTKFDLLDIGKRLCKECNECLVQRCFQPNELKLFVGSSCRPLLKLKHPLVNQVRENISIGFDFVHNQTEVFTVSIVCMDNKILAWLKLNIDETYIDKELFQRNFAAGLDVPKQDVQVSVFDVDGINSTSMVVRLSSLAATSLLTVGSREMFRNDFGKTLAQAMSSKLKRRVSISVIISDMYPYLMQVVPTGTYLDRSDKDVGSLISDGKTFSFYELSVKCTYSTLQDMR